MKIRLTIEMRELARDLETFSNIVAPYRPSRKRNIGRNNNFGACPNYKGCILQQIGHAYVQEKDETTLLAEKLAFGDFAGILEFLQNAIEENDSFSIDAEELLERVYEIM